MNPRPLVYRLACALLLVGVALPASAGFYRQTGVGARQEGDGTSYNPKSTTKTVDGVKITVITFEVSRQLFTFEVNTRDRRTVSWAEGIFYTYFYWTAPPTEWAVGQEFRTWEKVIVNSRTQRDGEAGKIGVSAPVVRTGDIEGKDPLEWDNLATAVRAVAPAGGRDVQTGATRIKPRGQDHQPWDYVIRQQVRAGITIDVIYHYEYVEGDPPTTPPPTTGGTDTNPPSTTGGNTNPPSTSGGTDTNPPSNPGGTEGPSVTGPTEQGGTTGTTVRLVAGQVEAYQNDLVWVPVRVENAKNLASMNFDLTFDSGGATPVAFTGGEFPVDMLFECNTGQSGRVRAGFAGPQGVDGSYRALSIRFRATGAPGTRVRIRPVLREADDPTGRSISATTQDGWIEIRAKDEPLEANTLNAQIALRMSIDLIPSQDRYDVNKDGSVTARDATLILQQQATNRTNARTSQ